VGDSIEVMVLGLVFTFSTPITVTVDTATGGEGMYYYYISSLGVLSYTKNLTEALSSSVCLLGELYWSASTNSSLFLACRRNSYQTSPKDLQARTKVKQNASWLSGLNLTGFTAGTGSNNTEIQFTIQQGTVYITDQTVSIPSSSVPSQIPIYYRSGADSSLFWSKKSANNNPLIASGEAGYTGANGRISYNLLSGGSWSLAEAVEGSYVYTHIFASSVVTGGMLFGIQGTNDYTSLLEAEQFRGDEVTTIMNTFPMNNKVYLGSVLFTTASTYTNTVKATHSLTYKGVDYEDTRNLNPTTPLLNRSAQSGLILPQHINNDPWTYAVTENQDFVNPSLGTTAASQFIITTSGTGAAVNLASSTGGGSLIRVTTGTTATGAASWHSNGQIQIPDIAFTRTNWVWDFYFDWYVIVPSTTAQAYTIRLGLLNGIGTTDAAGFYIRYTHSVNSGNLQCVVRNTLESTITTSVPGYTGVVTRYPILLRVVKSRYVYWYINNQIQNNGIPITTNIPYTLGFWFVMSMVKSAGTTSMSGYLDYFRVVQYIQGGR
jgi:hypothetical protein